MGTPKHVFVTGDFVLDSHIYEGNRHQFGDQRHRGVNEFQELGGAALIHYLLCELEELRKDSLRKARSQRRKDFEKRKPEELTSEEREESRVLKLEERDPATLSQGELKELRELRREETECRIESHLSVRMKKDRRTPDIETDKIPAHLKSYAVWKGLGDGKSQVKLKWLTQDAMGFGELPEDRDDKKEEEFSWPKEELNVKPKILVLSEGGMGFRDEKEQWPNDSLLEQTDWIVLKAADPLMKGGLWEKLTTDKKPTTDDWRSKLVVIVSASDLRKERANISKGLSWDATVESVLTELAAGGNLNQLMRCRYLVVVFGTEGALWLETPPDDGEGTAHLIYDADAVEGEHRRPEKGTAFGSLSCLTAAVAWYLASGGKEPDLETALERGLSAVFNLFDEGHGPATARGDGYPRKRLAAVIKKATGRFARMVFAFQNGIPTMKCPHRKRPARADTCWSLIHESLRHSSEACPDPAWALATLTAKRGPIALGSLPHIKIGKLMSADRREIETLRVLSRLIIHYRDRDPRKCKKPLSIGVFGPPGAGKSFAVKQITEEFLDKSGWLEFNLAQFEQGTEDLIGAFHQVRDRALTGKTPVAFFDEFDSRNYQWLQYLLAPMQDGAFQVGQITHPIGKCIFIFAGGTSWTFDSFGPSENDDPEAYERFKMLKGPDFKSRLDGFLNLLGPNQNEIAVESPKGLPGENKNVPDPCDIFYPLRRAFIIRGELGLRASDKLNMDDGVLSGLLHTSKYAHGARSLSKVLDPLKDASPGRIYLSHLPPPQQLALHADVETFMGACNDHNKKHGPGPSGEGKQLNEEEMAAEIHNFWCKLGRDQGWLDPENDVEYKYLSAFYKNSNRAAVRRMVDVLALIGLELRAGTNTPEEKEVIRIRLEHYLEPLAEAEHAGWMDWHLDQGWMYGPEKDKTPHKKYPEKRTHPCLKPYIELSDLERDKDRHTIRSYLAIAERGHMKIVEIGFPLRENI